MYVEHSEFCHLDADCNLGSRIRADNNQWLPLVGFLLFRSERPIVRLSSLRSSACLCLVPTVSHLPGYCRIFIAQTYQQFAWQRRGHTWLDEKPPFVMMPGVKLRRLTGLGMTILYLYRGRRRFSLLGRSAAAVVPLSLAADGNTGGIFIQC